MSVLDSLLTAILRADGDALIMHVGEKPTVVTAAGPILLTAGALTLPAMDELLRDLLSIPDQQALLEFGAVEAVLPAQPVARGERFTVVAARGGDDIWIELRRQRGKANGAARVAIAAPDTGGRAFEDAPLELPVRRPSPPGRDAERPPLQAGGATRAAAPESPANILPLRKPARADATVHVTASRLGRLERLLRLAAARGADAVYVCCQAPPSIRVDRTLAALDGEPPHSAPEVEALLFEVAPPDLPQPLAAAEWALDVPDIGRIHCTAFRDCRGPGGVFRIVSTKTLTAAELGLSRRMQLLAGEPDGLVLVTGPRGSGKSTVLAALVEQITRTRSEHVIVVERRARVLHESRSAVLSQREVRGDTAELLGAVRAARREDPDVLVIDGLYTPELAAEALDAAASGSFVVVSVPAPSACRAIERLAAGAPKDRQAAARGQLADGLRGAVGQVLLRKAGGGVVAARELLLNNRLVADAVAEGAWDRLPLAMETGRRDGMVPLTDALLGFVRGGAVDVREAWRAAADREGLLAALKREGIDTSFAERLA